MKSHIVETENAAPRIAFPPGLDPEAHRTPYRCVFFGAEKEWASDDHGWQKVGRYTKRPQYHARRQELMRRRAREEMQRNA
jgi:hypothetical protein